MAKSGRTQETVLPLNKECKGSARFDSKWGMKDECFASVYLLKKAWIALGSPDKIHITVRAATDEDV